ncbi:MAG: phosphatase PAP2 family protein [Lachnospiraceae bacterium]|nr:phosphatase PAP2 family protein [Lachnospiraceae bacterium]
MSESMKRKLILSGVLLFVFVVFSFSVVHADLKMVNVLDAKTMKESSEMTEVGMSTLNIGVAEKIGYRKGWYILSEAIGIVGYFTAAFFAVLGVLQVITRKGIGKADKDLYLLAVFYVLVALTYLIFEVVVLNCRPVLLKDELEASYPSSHTLLGICIFSTAAMQFQSRLPKKNLRVTAVTVCMVLMGLQIISRLLSGVHWLTDIIGGILISAFLISLYLLGYDIIERLTPKNAKK